MAIIYKTKRFTASLAEEENDTREKIESRITSLTHRKELVPVGNIRPFGNIMIYRLVRSMNAVIIIQKIKAEIDNGYIYMLRDYVSSNNIDKIWHRKYEPLLKERKWEDQYPLEDEEINLAQKSYKEKGEEESKVKILPDALLNWDNHLRQPLEVQLDIFETKDWIWFVNPFNKENRINFGSLTTYRSLIRRIANNKTSGLERERINIEPNEKVSYYEGKNEHDSRTISEDEALIRSLFTASHDDATIVYEDVTTPDGQKYIILHGGIENKEYKQVVISNAKFFKIAEIETLGYTGKAIRQSAVRAYPKQVLLDSDNWRKIQNSDDSSNLSLLPEQTDLIKDICYPSFINGQAGSGKSTMLYYLFAHILRIKEFNNLEGDVVFFTENKHLLETTKNSVKSLFDNNPEFTDFIEPRKLNDYFNGQKIFKTLTNFIHNELLSEEDKTLFPIENFVGFTDFKLWYQKEAYIKASVKNNDGFSAEYVWFVITTYIKGHHSDRLLTPFEFLKEEEIARENLDLVGKDHYKIIFEDIYEPFYKKYTSRDEENGIYKKWDRWDLVKFILNTYNSLPKQFAVIFSDECQDFSKIETELILKLSSFSGYSLDIINNLPIVLAGDPFQTVSPTGFNLSRVKDVFYSKLNKDLGFKYDWSKFTVNLQYNYRSTPAIVNLANLVQYSRYKFVGEDKIKEPQDAKQPRFNIQKLPKIYTLLNDQSDKTIIEKFDKDNIIIPVDIGEENDFKDADNYLTKEYEAVLSPIQAKGSEYDKVFIYKFGDTYAKGFGNFKEEVKNDSKEESSQGYQFSRKFFFNKLYVAITRAKNDLVILDTEEGLNRFWSVFQNNFLSIYLSENPDWENKLDLNNVFEEVIDINALKLQVTELKDHLKSAEEELEKGKHFENIDKLKRAKYLFKKIYEVQSDNHQLYEKQRICDAVINHFEHNYLESGNIYRTLFNETGETQYLEKASTEFFIGGAWNEILSIKNDDTDLSIRQLIACICLGINFDIEKFFKSKAEIESQLAFASIHKASWQKSYRRALFQLLREWTNNEDVRSDYKKLLYDYLTKTIEESTIPSPESINILAKYNFSRKAYQDAVFYWELLDDKDVKTHNSYILSKIEIAINEGDFDTEIYYRDKRGADLDNIIKKYESTPKDYEYSYESKKIIFRAYLKEKKLEKAILMPGIQAKDIINNWVESKDNGERGKLVKMQLLFFTLIEGLERKGPKPTKFLVLAESFLIQVAEILISDYPTLRNLFKAELPWHTRKEIKLNQAIAQIRTEKGLEDILDQIIDLVSLTRITPSEATEQLAKLVHLAKYSKLDQKSYKFNDDTDILHLKKIGVAIERTDVKFNNSLPFYDEMAVEVDSKDWKHFSTHRWAKVKQKQLTRDTHSQDMAVTEKFDNKDISKKWQEDFEDFLSKVNLNDNPYKIEWNSLDQIDDYPIISHELEEEIDIDNPQSLHIYGLKINGFKGFSSLSLENFGQFNLIVGDNNAGKTTLLESLLLEANIDKSIVNLAFVTGDRSKEALSGKTMKNLFDDLVSTDIDGRQISFEYSFFNQGSMKLVLSESQDGVVSAYLNSKIESVQSDISNFNFENTKIDPSSFAFIPFGRAYEKKLSKLWTQIIQTPKQETEFENAMKCFIPNIYRIRPNDKTGIEIAENNRNEYLRLYNYGEGSNKLFRILLHIVNNRGKIVLIDEIDAGIYFERFKTFWKVLLSFAKSYDVQLFATTHNEECVEYLKEILDDEESTDSVFFRERTRVITLRRNIRNGQIVPLVRDYNDLINAFDQDQDVRNS